MIKVANHFWHLLMLNGVHRKTLSCFLFWCFEELPWIYHIYCLEHKREPLSVSIDLLFFPRFNNISSRNRQKPTGFVHFVKKRTKKMWMVDKYQGKSSTRWKKKVFYMKYEKKVEEEKLIKPLSLFFLNKILNDYTTYFFSLKSSFLLMNDKNKFLKAPHQLQ